MKIRCRYQYWSSEGIKWTNWFYQPTGEAKTLEDFETLLKKYRKDIENIDKSTKLKHEYEIVNE